MLQEISHSSCGKLYSESFPENSSREKNNLQTDILSNANLMSNIILKAVRSKSGPHRHQSQNFTDCQHDDTKRLWTVETSLEDAIQFVFPVNVKTKKPSISTSYTLQSLKHFLKQLVA